MLAWLEAQLANWGPWQFFGLLGTLMFTSRFAVQWILSERAGRSYVPVAFWYLSLFGAMILLIYAIHIGDPIFIIGQSFGWIVYLRNLVLLKRSGASLSPSAEGNAPPTPARQPAGH